MKLLSLIAISLLSTTAFASTIVDATSNKSLLINCGNQQDGSIKLTVSGKQGRVYLDSQTYETPTTITEDSNGDYSVVPNDRTDMIIRISRDQLQATIYQVFPMPFSEIAFKRVNCTWTRQ